MNISRTNAGRAAAALPPLILLALVALGPGPIACGSESKAELTVVEAQLVCMVNDRFFGSEQIPVRVEDRTYYGCCAGCEQKIRENAQIRSAVDPVSGAAVDKATAVIGMLPEGDVLYFESERNLARFRQQPRT